ncbi:hypothetical protein VTO73DRAFT_5274 [Trametes versicolor]
MSVPENVLDIERYLLAGDLIIGIAYGLQVALWCLCISYLWPQRTNGWKARLLLGYLVLLMVVETTLVVTQARITQLIFVDSQNSPGGSLEFQVQSQTSPLNVVSDASIIALALLADLLIWLIGNCVLSVLGVLWVLTCALPELSTRLSTPLALGTAYCAVSLVLNIVLTGLITLRLFAYRRAHTKLMPADHGSQYLSLAAIVIESAAIALTFGVAFIVLFSLNNPGQNDFFIGCASGAQQVAIYLVIYRVANGKAWSRDAPRLRTVTTLKFASHQNAPVLAPFTDSENTSLPSSLQIDYDEERGDTHAP